VNAGIQQLRIEVISNPHYGGARSSETVASLVIPNQLFLLWDRKITLQKRLGTSVSQHLDMANSRIKEGYNAIVIKSSGQSFEKRLIAASQR